MSKSKEKNCLGIDDESQKSVNAYTLHRNIDIGEWLS